MEKAKGSFSRGSGLRVIADDVDGHMAEALAREHVGEADGFRLVAGETVLRDAVCKR